MEETDDTAIVYPVVKQVWYTTQLLQNPTEEFLLEQEVARPLEVETSY